MIPKKIDDIEKQDLAALVENATSEGRTIEYKESIVVRADNEKKEFLADVSSFANVSGGDLIFGIKEIDGVPVEIPGLKDFEADKDILRLEEIIRNGVDPRIPGIQMKSIEGFPAGPALLIRIPKSWASPHMVAYKGTSRFFTRNNAGKYQMDVTEIRSAFALSEALPDKMRRFRDDRLGKIIAGETPVALQDRPKMVLHLFPLAAFSLNFRLDPNAIKNQSSNLKPFGGLVFSERFNVDGYVTVEGPIRGSSTCTGYCQTFRNGIIETVGCNLIADRQDGTRSIPSVKYEKNVLQSLDSAIKSLISLEVPAPVVISLSFLGVHGCEMDVNGNYRPFRDEVTTIDRDVVVLPDVVIEDYGSEIADIVRPVFDAIWNAAGWERSLNYDQNGKWRGQS